MNSAYAKLNVLTSIRPIYSIFKNIAKEEINLDYLLKNSGSAHDIYIRPSDIAKLKNADLIFIINRHFEAEIWSVITKLHLEDKTIELTESQGIKLLSNKEIFSLTEDVHLHHHENEDEHEHDHHHHKYDYHIWLDISNAHNIGLFFKNSLVKNAPSLKEKLQTNLDKFSLQLITLKKLLEQKISTIKSNNNFMQYHNGYQYFEENLTKFGISERDKGSITYGHHQLPSIKQIRSLVDYIKENNVRCIFLDPDYNKKFISKIINLTGVKTEILNGEFGPKNIDDENIYFAIINDTADSFKKCLN